MSIKNTTARVGGRLEHSQRSGVQPAERKPSLGAKLKVPLKRLEYHGSMVLRGWRNCAQSISHNEVSRTADVGFCICAASLELIESLCAAVIASLEYHSRGEAVRCSSQTIRNMTMLCSQFILFNIHVLKSIYIYINIYKFKGY